MSGLHPLDWQDDAAEWMGQSLRATSPRAQLVSDTRALRPGAWLVVRPGQSWPLERILGAAAVAQPRGLVVDETDRSSVELWLQSQQDGGLRPALELRVLALLPQRMGILASAFYGHPSHRIRVTAVTGTNGKSTAVHLLAQAWARLGQVAASIGTLGVRRFGPDGSVSVWAGPGLTSWDPVSLQAQLDALSQSGVSRVALEASSIGLQQHRLSGCRLWAAGLTSLASDHLDFHGSLTAYGAAKAALFAQPGLGCAVQALPLQPLAEGHPVGMAWAPIQQALQSLPPGVLTQVSVAQGARIELTEPLIEGLEMRWQVTDHETGERACCLLPLGHHQAQNAAVVLGLLVREGISLTEAAHALDGCTAPEGRLAAVGAGGSDQPAVFVDYAHTADGLEQICTALAPLVRARGGRLRLVFGCGGDRDRLKRPEMGRIAASLADRVVVTADNPRSEPMAQILDDIRAGIPPHPRARVEFEPDRAAAIQLAIGQASPLDVVLIAGKGHEQTQVIQGQALPFSDEDQAQQALAGYRPPPTLGALCSGLSGVELRGDASALSHPIEGVVTDSRRVRPGDLFVALAGAHHNGHDFLESVAAQGVAGVVVSAPAPRSVRERLAVAQVPSTLAALGELSAAWRAAAGARVWAVTGSNGKTTVKEMLRSIAQAELGPAAVWATPGNLNNEIGLPLSLLGIRPPHRLAVLEIGMNHPGELEPLAAHACPEAAILTNAQREHQAFMETVQACARENGTVFQRLRPGGIAVFPVDAPHEAIWREQAKGHRCLRFGLRQDFESGAAPAEGLEDVSGDWHPGGEQGPVLTLGLGGRPVQLQLRGLGRHFARNACGAAALAYAAGFAPEQIAAGLSGFNPIEGRGQLERLPSGDWLVDDTYNANPDSVLAAIEALSDQPGPKALVLGDMGEVGAQGPAFHREVLEAAQARGIDSVWLLGEACRNAQRETGIGQVVLNPDEAAEAVLDWLRARTAAATGQPATVWFKASRFMQLEHTFQAVRQAALQTKANHAALSH